MKIKRRKGKLTQECLFIKAADRHDDQHGMGYKKTFKHNHAYVLLRLMRKNSTYKYNQSSM